MTAAIVRRTSTWLQCLDSYETKDGDTRIAKTFANVVNVLTLHPDWDCLAFDEFRNKIIAGREPPALAPHRIAADYPREWTDHDNTRTMAWLEAILGFTPTKQMVLDAVEAAADRNRVHGIRTWLESLEWDGIPRAAKLWSRYFGAEDNRYHDATSSAFLVGMVARIMRPGCKLDTMPILEGRQGAGKSSGLKALAGAAWFSDTPPNLDRPVEAYQALDNVWLLEIAELDGMDRHDAKRIKAFLSSSADRYRRAYGHYSGSNPRQSVCIGTTNDDRYLRDDTGSRRFWIVAVGAVDVAAIERDRDQLFAEAVAAFRDGARWWLDAETEALAAEAAEDRRLASPRESLIAAWLHEPTRHLYGDMSESWDRDRFSLDDICAHALRIPHGRATVSDSAPLGKMLLRLGCKEAPRGPRPLRKRYYYFPSWSDRKGGPRVETPSEPAAVDAPSTTRTISE